MSRKQSFHSVHLSIYLPKVALFLKAVNSALPLNQRTVYVKICCHAAATRSQGPVAQCEIPVPLPLDYQRLFTMATRRREDKTEYVVRFKVPPVLGENERIFIDEDKAYNFMQSEYKEDPSAHPGHPRTLPQEADTILLSCPFIYNNFSMYMIASYIACLEACLFVIKTIRQLNCETGVFLS